MATTTNIESTKRHLLRGLESVARCGDGTSCLRWRRADPTGSELVTAS